MRLAILLGLVCLTASFKIDTKGLLEKLEETRGGKDQQKIGNGKGSGKDLLTKCKKLLETGGLGGKGKNGKGKGSGKDLLTKCKKLLETGEGADSAELVEKCEQLAAKMAEKVEEEDKIETRGLGGKGKKGKGKGSGKDLLTKCK